METTNLTAKEMYRIYGISEWNEKRLVLSPLEVESIYSDLNKNFMSPLLALVRMPFPHFIAIYLQRFPDVMNLMNDPAIGYKLYMLSNQALRFVVESYRNPTLTPTGVIKKFHLHQRHREEVSEILYNPFENVLKLISVTNRNLLHEKKFAYLTQYIDLKEARRLGLSLVSTFEADGCDGFEFERKLQALNPAARLAMALSLGLYGEDRKSMQEIAKIMKVNDYRIDCVYKILFPLFRKPTGEMLNLIGFKKKNYEPESAREYTNKQFRDYDIALQSAFIISHLSESEKLVLSSYSQRAANIYIAAKYLFKTPESLAANLDLSLEEATKSYGEK